MDENVGLIHKYDVERVDGRNVRWCFVLEDTDPLAIPALQAYADAAEAAGYQSLANDLRAKASEMPLPRKPWPNEVDHDTFLAWVEPR